jgi:hypothetical protein
MADTPSDEMIIAQIGTWGPDAMTYVIANRLRNRFPAIRTDWVLRQLKRLERQGRVARCSSNYAVQLCWRVPHPNQGEV